MLWCNSCFLIRFSCPFFFPFSCPTVAVLSAGKGAAHLKSFQVGQELWEYQNWFRCRASKYVTQCIYNKYVYTHLSVCAYVCVCVYDIKTVKSKPERKGKSNCGTWKGRSKKTRAISLVVDLCVDCCTQSTDIFLFYEWKYTIIINESSIECDAASRRP